MKTKKILSFLAAAAISASAFAGLTVTASAANATEDAYVVWNVADYTDDLVNYTFTDADYTTAIPTAVDKVNKPSGTAIYVKPTSDTKNIHATFMCGKEGQNKELAKQSFDQSSCSNKITNLEGTEMEFSDTAVPGLKPSASHQFTFDTKFSELNAEGTVYSSYDIQIIFGSNDKNKADMNFYVADGEKSNAWGEVTAPGATGAATAVTLHNQTADTITLGLNNQPKVFYMAIKYNAPSTGGETKKYTVTYADTDIPVAEVVEGETITLPALPVKDGFTAIGWNDGNITHKAGEKYTVTNTVTFTAVYEEIVPDDPVSGEYTASWTFRTDAGCPAFNSQGADTPIDYATIATDGKTATMSINTKNGKLANANWSDWTQMNTGTTVTIPAYYGMKISWDVMTKGNEFTIDGTNYTSGQYIYTGNADTLTLTAGAFSYIRSFSVEPATPTASTVKVSNVELFNKTDKTSEATVFNAEVSANDFVVKGLKFENNDNKKETITEIAQGSTAVFVVVYEKLATQNPIVEVLN